MDVFPAFFPLAGRRVVIAGTGEPAEGRARLLGASPAEIVRLDGPAAADPAAYRGAALAFIASHDDGFAATAAAAARQAGTPVNVLDRPALSDFHTPAIVDRGAVVVAVGSTGSAPVLAQLLRADIETRVPEEAGRLAAVLGARRREIRAAFPDFVARRAFVRAILSGPVAHLARQGDMAGAEAKVDEAIASGGAPKGLITLIAKPASDDLISLRALRALSVADVVAAPPEADPLVANHARRDVERLALETGSADHLAELARSGKLVAVIGGAPELAADLAAAGAAFEHLGSAPEAP